MEFLRKLDIIVVTSFLDIDVSRELIHIMSPLPKSSLSAGYSLRVPYYHHYDNDSVKEKVRP